VATNRPELSHRTRARLWVRGAEDVVVLEGQTRVLSLMQLRAPRPPTNRRFTLGFVPPTSADKIQFDGHTCILAVSLDVLSGRASLDN
jgi:hypothetical protein